MTLKLFSTFVNVNNQIFFHMFSGKIVASIISNIFINEKGTLHAHWDNWAEFDLDYSTRVQILVVSSNSSTVPMNKTINLIQAIKTWVLLLFLSYILAIYLMAKLMFNLNMILCYQFFLSSWVFGAFYSLLR